jgi:hypothetical protein
VYHLTMMLNGDQSVILRGGSGFFTGRVPFAWFGYAFYNNGATYGAYDNKPSGSKAGTNPLFKHLKWWFKLC